MTPPPPQTETIALAVTHDLFSLWNIHKVYLLVCFAGLWSVLPHTRRTKYGNKYLEVGISTLPVDQQCVFVNLLASISTIANTPVCCSRYCKTPGITRQSTYSKPTKHMHEGKIMHVHISKWQIICKELEIFLQKNKHKCQQNVWQGDTRLDVTFWWFW